VAKRRKKAGKVGKGALLQIQQKAYQLLIRDILHNSESEEVVAETLAGYIVWGCEPTAKGDLPNMLQDLRKGYTGDSEDSDDMPIWQQWAR